MREGFHNKLAACLDAMMLAAVLVVLEGCSAIGPLGQRTSAASAANVLQRATDNAYARFKDDTAGQNADFIHAHAASPSKLFGICIVTTNGLLFSAGDVNHAFPIRSCSKVFTLCQVLQEAGEGDILEKIGVEPTGMPLNSVTALGLHTNQAVNGLVNCGAIAVVSMVKAASAEERWNKILAYDSKLAGEPLKLMDEIYKSEAASNWLDRGMASILYGDENLFCDPKDACDVYSKQCSIAVTARQLAVMGATLANGGVNPVTKERCIDAKYVPRVLAIMMIAGLYDESGAWAFNSGLPAAAGVSGAVVAIAPGKMCIVGFSPPLNEAGNSVRATKAIDYLIDELGLSVFGPSK